MALEDSERFILKQQPGKQSKSLPAGHSSTIALLSISHRSEDFWVLPFNSFSVSKNRFK